MAVVTGSLIATQAPKIVDSIGGLFSGRSSKRASRDRIKNQLIEIGVRRSAWRNFNSNSVKAGRDLLKFLLSNPYAVDEFNLQFSGKNITRSNVDSFISNVSRRSGGSSTQKSSSGVSESGMDSIKKMGSNNVIFIILGLVGIGVIYNTLNK